MIEQNKILLFTMLNFLVNLGLTYYKLKIGTSIIPLMITDHRKYKTLFYGILLMADYSRRIPITFIGVILKYADKTNLCVTDFKSIQTTFNIFRT